LYCRHAAEKMIAPTVQDAKISIRRIRQPPPFP
jgi:hypothetical protein